MCKSQNGELVNGMIEMRRIRVGMRGMGSEYGYGETSWECEDSECNESRWKRMYSGRNDIE